MLGLGRFLVFFKLGVFAFKMGVATKAKKPLRLVTMDETLRVMGLSQF